MHGCEVCQCAANYPTAVLSNNGTSTHASARRWRLMCSAHPLLLLRRWAQEGMMRRHSHVAGDSLELNLHSTTAGVALLSLHCWLQDTW